MSRIMATEGMKENEKGSGMEEGKEKEGEGKEGADVDQGRGS